MNHKKNHLDWYAMDQSIPVVLLSIVANVNIPSRLLTHRHNNYLFSMDCALKPRNINQCAVPVWNGKRDFQPRQKDRKKSLAWQMQSTNRLHAADNILQATAYSTSPHLNVINMLISAPEQKMPLRTLLLQLRKYFSLSTFCLEFSLCYFRWRHSNLLTSLI